MAGSKGKKFDWVTIFIYVALVAIGWINIYSASYNTTSTALITGWGGMVREVLSMSAQGNENTFDDVSPASSGNDVRSMAQKHHTRWGPR